MIKLIDKTLTQKIKGDASSEQIILFCELLIQLGVDTIEMNQQIFDFLHKFEQEKLLNIPVLIRLKSDHISEEYSMYECISSVKKGETHLGIISDLRLNDVKELTNLIRSERQDNFRISGLSSFLHYDYKVLLSELNRAYGNRVSFCPSDSFFSANALAVEWLLAGGKKIATSFCGYGSFAASEVVLLAMKVISRKRPGKGLAIIPEISKLFEQITGEQISSKQPVVGKAIFDVEAGIHADGLAKGSHLYEPYLPQIVGNSRQLVVGKHSGLKAIKLKLKEYDYQLSEKHMRKLLQDVQNDSICKQRSLTDEEFCELVIKLKKSEAAERND